jgi:putative ABC transport system substrate-binding protein
MRRREFITLLGGGAIAFPLTAIAEQRTRRIGVLNGAAATDTFYQQYIAGFVETLRNLGWVDGQNLRLDIRWNGGDASLARAYAAELVALSPDVILSVSTTNLMALQEVTRSIPIVFLQVSDPVAQGFVPNLIRPGGNVTGFTNFEFSIGEKWVELLKQVAPDLSRVAVMSNPDTSPQTKYFLRAIEAAAASLGVQAVATPVRSVTDIESAIEDLARQPNGGLSGQLQGGCLHPADIRLGRAAAKLLPPEWLRAACNNPRDLCSPRASSPRTGTSGGPCPRRCARCLCP